MSKINVHFRGGSRNGTVETLSFAPQKICRPAHRRWNGEKYIAYEAIYNLEVIRGVTCYVFEKEVIDTELQKFELEYPIENYR